MIIGFLAIAITGVLLLFGVGLATYVVLDRQRERRRAAAERGSGDEDARLLGFINADGSRARRSGAGSSSDSSSRDPR